jgi:aspartate/methionine/tyrosine aminotransferase
MITPAERTRNFNYAIREIVSAAQARERRGQSVCYLNIGDPQAFGFRPPDHVVEAVVRAMREGFTGYAPSEGLLKAREAVARYATELGAYTEPKDIIISAGASEAADLILSALVNAGDEVLLPSPGYPLYQAILKKLGAIPRYYQLDEGAGWHPSVSEARSLISDRTKALLIINPNNPTGSIIPDETTRLLVELASEHGLLVISDEVYRDLCFGVAPVSASVFAQQLGAPLITLESLSKTHMVPGWRVGWMRFTHSEKMADLIRAITVLASGRLCSPTPAQYAIQPALEGDRTFLGAFIGSIRKRRDCALTHVEQIDGLSCVSPEAAFYMMIKVNDLGGMTDAGFVLNLLEETGVLVVHGSGFGLKPEAGYFRLVYLADEAVLKTAFAGLDHFLKRAG